MLNNIIGRVARALPENNRRERIWKLAQVEFKSRYYNDSLGLLWALIKPVFEVLLYYMVFVHAFKVEKDNFALFLFGGVISWMLFRESTTRGMLMLKQKLYLIENIQVKKIDLYLSFLLSVFIAFCFNFSAFLLVGFATGKLSFENMIYLPVVVITILMISLGVTLILSCVQPFIKDLRHAWDMILFAGFWVSGIFFDHSMFTDKFPFIYYLNPFVGIIHNIHASTLSGYEIDFFILFFNLLYAAVLLGIGLITLRKYGGLAVEKI